MKGSKTGSRKRSSEKETEAQRTPEKHASGEGPQRKAKEIQGGAPKSQVYCSRNRERIKEQSRIECTSAFHPSSICPPPLLQYPDSRCCKPPRKLLYGGRLLLLSLDSPSVTSGDEALRVCATMRSSER